MLSVSEIGAVCGFENNCSFSRAFRERYGTPPSLYRLEVKRGGTAETVAGVTPDSAQLRGSERKAALAFGT
jgi:AraC family transcriptional regulator